MSIFCKSHDATSLAVFGFAILMPSDHIFFLIFSDVLEVNNVYSVKGMIVWIPHGLGNYLAHCPAT